MFCWGLPHINHDSQKYIQVRIVFRLNHSPAPFSIVYDWYEGKSLNASILQGIKMCVSKRR